MRLVGLISGGKDSIYNMLQCIAAGHEVVAVANIEPHEKKDELDSYMYQTVGHQAISLLAGAISLPIYRQKTKGTALCKEKLYVETPGDEVEDLFALISKVKEEMHIEGVSVGAIASDYQRTRVENICNRLNLKCYAFLWQRDQEELLQEMIDAEMNVIMIKVASLGLNPEAHLGVDIKNLKPLLVELHKKFGVNVCGEGGEYETFTLDCLLFHRAINVIEAEKVIHSNDAFAPIGYLNIKNANLEPKKWDSADPLESMQTRTTRITAVVKKPDFYVEDVFEDTSSSIFPQSPKHRKPLSPEVLPFPFNAPEKPADSSTVTFHEYWKSSTSTAKPQQSQTASFPLPILANIDTTVFQLNLTTGWCCVGNVTAPTIKEGLAYVKKHLEMNQYTMQDIVSVILYVRDLNEWPKINKIYSQSFTSHQPPTRACVATHLPPDSTVLMIVLAHRLTSKTQKVMQRTVNKEVLHVQSISHWAPANIGPYSQCIRVGDIFYIAGQIPLIPGTMELLNKPIFYQCRLALRHVSRILKCLNNSSSLSNVLQGICYVTSEEIAPDIFDMWNYITGNGNAVIAVVVVSALPRNAQLEWQIIASAYKNPQYDRTVENITADYRISCTRCLFPIEMTSSVVCNVSYVNEKSVKAKPVTAEEIQKIMKYCLHYLRFELKNCGTPLTILNFFHKVSDSSLSAIIGETAKSIRDFKVVTTCIPVSSCSEPDIFLTVTGVCH